MNGLQRPELEEVVPFYRGYIGTAEGGDLFEALERASSSFHAVIDGLSEEQGSHRYAPGKWSIKEVVQHMIDTERIMAYRALCFARADATPLPGFDENAYADHSAADRRTLADLIAEHDAVRLSTVMLFRSFNNAALLLQGTANDRSFTVRALGWTIAGHSLHHVHILDQRYLDHGQA
jgi:hypothetical protein